MIHSDNERIAPTSISEAEPSHLARYQFALKHTLSDHLILDVPCGTGYGSNILASNNSRVHGVDINADAIDHAIEFFLRDNISYHVGNMENLGDLFTEDQIFDRIVSFEGIEHIANPDNFLKESVRLLKKDGLLIISTPRKPHGSPHHIVEYSQDEFEALLNRYLSVNKMYGQIFTDIFDIQTRDVNPHSYKRFNYIAICNQK